MATNESVFDVLSILHFFIGLMVAGIIFGGLEIPTNTGVLYFMVVIVVWEIVEKAASSIWFEWNIESGQNIIGDLIAGFAALVVYFILVWLSGLDTSTMF